MAHEITTYMVRAADGRPIDICANVPRAFERSLNACAGMGIGSAVSVVAVEGRSRERIVGTFQRINAGEVWCVTPMFPQGTVMFVSKQPDGAPVRRFGIPQEEVAEIVELRSLLNTAHSLFT